MASNKRRGIVEVESGDDLYMFKSGFDFLESINETVGDPMKIYIEFAQGLGDPTKIKNVMIAAAKTKNGVIITKPDQEMRNLIDANGHQECWILCQHLLSYAMIGDIKKIDLDKLKQGNLSKIITEPFLLENLRNRRLLWAYHLAVSGVCACLNFSLYMLYIVLAKG